MKVSEIRHVLWTCLVLLCISFLAPRPLHAQSLGNAFWNRQWDIIEKQVQENPASLSPRDRVLWANALWIQQRWKESLTVFDGVRGEMPDELRSYSDMLVLLGLERMGRVEEARSYGREFCPLAPEELKYYAAFAMARLSLPEGKERWFREMADLATEKRQKIMAFEGILALPGQRIDDALVLLRLKPLHPQALDLVRTVPREDRSPEVSFALGYAAFLQGDFAGTLDALKEVSDDNPLGGRAAYYRGMAHFREKEYQKAFSVWKRLALEGEERYASAAVKRLAIMAGTSLRGAVLDLLEDTASRRDDRAGLGALFHLSKKSGEEEGEGFLERLARSYPLSDEAAELFWDQGWNAWKEKCPREALVFWERGLEGRGQSPREDQFLYWSGRALESLDRDREAKERFDELLEKHPRSYYARLAFPGVDLALQAPVPSALEGEPDQLESWGFVHYARLRYLAQGTPKALWRAARLASWMGDDRSAFLYATSLQGRLNRASTLSLPLMELLYPRPYQKRVSELKERFGVEELLVWSVMRQESGFDPQALSWVGASGLMQLMPATARDEARKLGEDVKDLSSPDGNLLLGVSHMAGLLGRFQRLDWSLAAYNAGGGSVKRWITGKEKVPPEEWIEDIPYDETRHYVKKVLGNLYLYRQIYANRQEVSN